MTKSKQVSYTDRQLKTFWAIFQVRCMFILLIAFLCFNCWTLYELFKADTTSTDNWKYLYVETFNGSTLFVVVLYFFRKRP